MTGTMEIGLTANDRDSRQPRGPRPLTQHRKSATLFPEAESGRCGAVSLNCKRAMDERSERIAERFNLPVLVAAGLTSR